MLHCTSIAAAILLFYLLDLLHLHSHRHVRSHVLINGAGGWCSCGSPSSCCYCPFYTVLQLLLLPLLRYRTFHVKRVVPTVHRGTKVSVILYLLSCFAVMRRGFSSGGIFRRSATVTDIPQPSPTVSTSMVYSGARCYLVYSICRVDNTTW